MEEDPIIIELPLPATSEVERRLEAWWQGDQERDELREWAAELVDRTVFPDLPTTDPRSSMVDLVLQLASDLPLVRADIPAMRAFLVGGDVAWSEWHRYIATRDWTFRRRHGWRPGK